MSLRLSEHPERDRPRERLWSVGPAALTGQELLAILLGTGYAGRDALVHPREVFRAAIAEAAAGIIVVHNHPSGDATPSADDRAVTRQLVDAGRLLDLPVYDHVIVGGDRYVSFAEAGLL